jgi:hypothetical protein
MNELISKTVKNTSENLNGQFAIEYPVMEAIAMDTIVLGTVIRTEFQNPTLMPSQYKPVHALSQAFAQASNVGFIVGTKMLPLLIASISLSDVMIMM